MILSVFGREVEVIKNANQWQALYIGNEGKKRIARDIVIPDNLPKSEILEYVADLCHEWATAKHNTVFIIQD